MSKNRTRSGFTIVEVAVILPIAVFVVLALLSMSIRLINDSSAQNIITKRMADIQIALDRIEQDISLSNAYLSVSLSGGHNSNHSCDYTDKTFSEVGSHFQPFKIIGQGDSKALVLQTLLTTDNPLTEDTVKNLVHVSSENGDKCSFNPPLFSSTVYYIKNGSLYRRVMLPDNVKYPEVSHLITTPSNCETPWQRPTCGQPDTKAINLYPDAKLLDDAEIEIEFFDTLAPNKPLNNIFSSGLDNESRQALLDSAVTAHIILKSKVTFVEGDTPTVVSGQLRANRIQ